MIDLLSKKWSLGILLTASILVHFLFFGHPNQIVFDEVHFGKFISAYYTHEYYFDIHPPLGKLIIAGFGKLFDFKPEFSFAEIGEKFPDNKYMALRFLPSLAGTLLPLVIYLLALELGFSRLAALIGGLLIIFENALLVQSRYILLDAFLLLGGFTSLLFYFRYHAGKGWKNLIGVGIGAGLAMSIKWTGLTFLALPAFIEIFELIKHRRIADILPKVACLVVLPLSIYAAAFAVHFSLLYKSGDGDAFMSQRFQVTLQGSDAVSDESPPSFIEKLIELNVEMYRSNQRLTADHPYGSKWYTWPLMTRPIYYWVDGQERIYLMGNPIIWWTSTLATVMLISMLIFETKRIKQVAVILLIGYVLNLLPFIGIQRVMFLYHYLTALIFAVLILIYLIDQQRASSKYFAVLAIVAGLSFVYFAPLTYGLPLEPEAYNHRTWLPSWR